MSDMIERIKRALPHDNFCASHVRWEYDSLRKTQTPFSAECNCPRREMVTFLERLGNPTQRMKDEGRYSRDCVVSGSNDLGDIFTAMLQAAQEGL